MWWRADGDASESVGSGEVVAAGVSGNVTFAEPNENDGIAVATPLISRECQKRGRQRKTCFIEACRLVEGGQAPGIHRPAV